MFTFTWHICAVEQSEVRSSEVTPNVNSKVSANVTCECDMTCQSDMQCACDMHMQCECDLQRDCDMQCECDMRCKCDIQCECDMQCPAQAQPLSEQGKHFESSGSNCSSNLSSKTGSQEILSWVSNNICSLENLSLGMPRSAKSEYNML